VTIDFVYDFVKLAVFSDQTHDGGFEHHRESVWTAAYDLPPNLDHLVEGNERKLEYNILIAGNASLRADKNAAGSNVFDDVSKHAFFD
jgi:hypothetical protein